MDNYSKYGPVTKSYDDHPPYTFVEGDVRDVDLMERLLDGCEHLVAGRRPDRRDLLLPHVSL